MKDKIECEIIYKINYEERKQITQRNFSFFIE